jgi:hypothetical protein
MEVMMFGWFAPRFPVGTWEKTWTETRMRWFADTLGIDRLRQARVVLPNEEFFPDPYDGTPTATRRLLERIAGYMSIDPGPIQLEVCDDDQLPGAAGHYDRSIGATIRVAASQLGHPDRLIATLAHELAHELLLGRDLIDPAAQDHEWTTDLLPAYLGVGIFAANTVIHDQSGYSAGMSWWKIGRQGYLPARVFGYAFALFAFVRGESEPSWAAHLRLDAAQPMRECLRYLQQTGDTLFHPDTVGRHPVTAPVSELIDRLQTGSPSVRMGALWELRTRGTAGADAVPSVADLLADRDPDIPGEAALTLGAMSSAAQVVVPQLREAMRRGRANTRAGAAQALAELLAAPDEVVPELASLLCDNEQTVADAAARALRCYGRQAEPATPQLLDALTAALVDCNDERASDLIQTLRAVTPDPEAVVRSHPNFRDRQLRRMALEAMRAG